MDNSNTTPTFPGDQVTVEASITSVRCHRCRRDFDVRVMRGPLTGKPMECSRIHCDDCERAIRDENAAEQERQRVDAFERRCARCVEELAAPAEYAGRTLASVRVDWGSGKQQELTGRALLVARRIIGELTNGLRPPPFLAFYGRPGNGKTLLAYAIAQELAGRWGKRCRVVRLSALVRDLREAWRGSGVSEASRLRRYIELDYLAIDEVSRDAFYGQPRQHLLDVINDRVAQRRPTIITTNEDIDGIEAILGPALMSRLALGGRVHFGDEDDFRQIPASEREAT